MRKQQRIWLEEHSNQATLPTMADVDAATGVKLFAEYLSEHGVTSGKVVDIGAGKGRNSVYLAEHGFEAFALEYIQPALDVAEKLALAHGVHDHVHAKLADLAESWDFPDNYFDLAVDSFSSIDIETRTGREVCRDEMYRTLKPGGLALITVVSAQDEWERDMIAQHPGPEPNSCVWPQNGKFQKDYDEDELREFYPRFEIVEFKTIQKPAHKLGRDGTATNLWMVVRKPRT